MLAATALVPDRTAAFDLAETAEPPPPAAVAGEDTGEPSADLAAAQREIRHLREALTTAEHRVALAETLAEAARQRAVALTVATAEALSRARSLEQRLAGAERSLAGANASIADRDERIASLDAEIAAAQRELATYDALYREAQRAMTELAIEAAAIDYQLQSVLRAGSTAAMPEREEIMAWQAVVLNDTPEAYRQYLARYPSGEFVREARRRLGNVLSRRVAAVPFDPATPAVDGTNPTDGGAEPIAENAAAIGHDAAVAVGGNEPEPPTAASGSHVVQLVSVLTMDEATSEWERLSSGYPDLLGTLEPLIDEVDLGDGGTWFRVQGGPLSRAEADALCADLVGRGAECIVRLR